MPCDELATAVAKILDPQVRVFETSVARTADEARGLLIRQGGSDKNRKERMAQQLGVFGTRHINTERFANLFRTEHIHSRSDDRKIEQAITTFDELAKAECEFFVAKVPAGGSLYETVRAALGRTGRAFGAARLAHSVASRRKVTEGNGVLTSFPFDRWNASERRTAPPLIVKVDGNDLRAASLGEFMDGTQKIVLVVNGPCSPAPLARLISPGTFVVQCESVDALKGLSQHQGPGIGAVVSGDCALFVHDPAGGSTIRDRLTVNRNPKVKPRKPVGGLSGAQQAEELQILTALLSTGIETPAVKQEPTKDEDPVDKLAAWLLTQADITDVS